MTISKETAYADVIVTPDQFMQNGVYHLFFVHESDREVAHFEFQESNNVSENKARYLKFMVDTTKFKIGGNYKLFIYAKEETNG